MLFNSIEFIIFFPVVVLLYFLLPRKVKMPWLLVASYYFYMSWNAVYGMLILASTAITYLCGRIIDTETVYESVIMTEQGTQKRLEARSNKADKPAEKGPLYHLPGAKAALIAGLVSNLGILFFFKYFKWLFGEFTSLFGIKAQMPFTIVLPVGISFYTFQALGYVIDVYRGDTKAEKNFLTYALFVSFFPQLVAGPIERSTNLLGQLKHPTVFDRRNAVRGLQIMLWGYVEKVVIADNLARVVDTVYARWEKYSGGALALATFLFIIQMYCDFGGYSHIAIGAAKVLNIDLMNNFRQPYFATSIREFWQRWHISLSMWFRDYLYFPLGGSRCSKWRKYLNIMITFLASGLWHGANWTYLIWGGMHGVFQIIGELTLSFRQRVLKVLHISWNGLGHITFQRIMVFLMFAVSMVFFRASSVQEAIQIFGVMVGELFHVYGAAGNGTAAAVSNLSGAGWLVTVIGLALLLAGDCMQELVENPLALGSRSDTEAHRHTLIIKECRLQIFEKIDRRPTIVRWICYYGLTLLVIAAALQRFGQGASAFLYFQF